jgi:hypothetical protein
VSVGKVAVFNDTRPDAHYGSQLVMRNLIYQLRHHGMEPAWFWPVGKDWRPHSLSIPRAPSIRAVIVNGEGSIHGSVTRERARFLPEIGRFSRDYLGAPAFLINTTLDRIGDEVFEDLRYFEDIYVRESGSLGLLLRHGIKGQVVPDLAFARKAQTGERRMGSVCGTDSVLAEVSAAIRDVCQRKGWPYRPMHYPELPRWQHAGKPYDFVHKLARGAVANLTGRNKAEFFMKFLSQHSLVLTGRFHSVVMCLLTQTPFLAVESNTPKISLLLRDVFGNANRIISLTALSGVDPETLRPWTEFETQSMMRYCLDAEERIAQMFAAIRARI